MKRTLSVILTLAMLISMCTVLFVTNVAAVTVISNTSPAITADVGETITLSNYSVTFDGDAAATSDITWKNGSSTITTFKPTAKGVTELTAVSGSKSKTIYVVAKEASETEYVLYEANMADFASIQALKNAGWTFPALTTASYAKASDGSLTLGVTGSYDLAYAYLPEWLSAFGDFDISADVKINSLVNGDTSRWFSVVYRADGRNGGGHYYQMAVRDAASNNGVEFAEQYNGWKVPAVASASISSMRSAYNKVKVEANAGNIAYYINDEQIIYVDDTTFRGSVNKYDSKGNIGFSMCGGTLAVKSVKVTVQETVPVEIIDVDLINNNNHGADNLLNPIANAQRLTTVNASNLSGLSVAFFNASAGNVTAAVEACVNANVVPTIYVASNAEADRVVAALDDSEKKDITVISDVASVLKYIRGKKSVIRTGLRVDISAAMSDGVLTAEEANDVRITVRNAPATFCVIDSKYATRDAVEELQSLAIGVWAVASNSSSNKTAFDKEVMQILTAGVNGIITDSASAVNGLVNTHFADNAVTRTPLVIGHRGNPSVAPENTIESFQAAYDNGADVFEIDVDLTKDNVVVILHDGTLTRTTTYDDGDGDDTKDSGKYISQMTWAEVQKYYVLDLNGKSTGKPIPTLEEVLNWARGKDIKIFIEFKSAAASCINQTMQLVKELDMEHQCDVISFAYSALTQSQANIPGMSTGYLLGNTVDAVSYERALKQIEGLLESAQKYKSTVNPQSYGGQVTRYAVQALTDRGMTVWPWTYSDATTDKAFFSFADGITTDNVETITDMVKTLYAEDAALAVGQSYVGGTVTAETYGNEQYLAEPSNIVASVISGDAVKVENGKLVAVKEGSATVMFGYVTTTAAGTEYTIYSQPVTVTVNSGSKKAVEALADIAEIATVNDLSEDDLIKLRKYQEKANAIVNGDVTATDAEIAQLATDINEILSHFYELVPIPAIGYTAPAPNYYKWDSATQSDSDQLNETYVDDGKRLIDGNAGNPNAGSNLYSAWAKGINVEIVVDYGTAIESSIFRGYFAAGQWGIAPPSNMKVYYSNDKKSWTLVEGKLEKLTAVDGSWDTYEYTLIANESVNARYIKFFIDPDGIFTWVDEVEALRQIGDYVQGEYATITGVNEKLGTDSSVIFTSDFGTINNAKAAFAGASGIIAKWDSENAAYVVTDVLKNISASKSVTLADDEILIVANGGTNKANLAKASADGRIALYGVDTENCELGIAPYVRVEGLETEPPVENPPIEDEYILGDVNDSGAIDMMDYILLKRNYFGTFDFDEGQFKRGDCNRSGAIDMMDYILLKRAYFGTFELK